MYYCSIVIASGNCTYGDVRLVGGSNQYEGRVEVCINEQWGTVCGDGWSSVDATVVCRQLDYAYTGSECKYCFVVSERCIYLTCFTCDTDGIPYYNAYFGAGTGPIYLDDVACTSSVNQLLECSSSPVLAHNCDHHADAGVGCEGSFMNTYEHNHCSM